MKVYIKNDKLFLVSLLFTLSVMSCKTNKTPVLIVPELTDEIQLSSSRVGAGQRVSATYTLPTAAPENVLSTQYSWFTPEYPELEMSGEIDANKKATKGFIAPKTLGEKQIKFVAKYTLSKGGNQIIKEKVKKINIEACDVATSFWGDSRQEVIKTTDAEFVEREEALECNYKPEYGDIEPVAIRYCIFTNNKLTNVIDTEKAKSPSTNLMATFALSIFSKAKDLKVTPKEFFTINLETNVKTYYTKTDLENNDDLLKRLNTEIKDKKIRAVARIETATTIHLSGINDHEGEWYIIHSHEPK